MGRDSGTIHTLYLTCKLCYFVIENIVICLIFFIQLYNKILKENYVAVATSGFVLSTWSLDKAGLARNQIVHAARSTIEIQ